MPVEGAAVPPGSNAPDFALEAAHGGRVSLRDYRGLKKVVLLFVHGFACPCCHQRFLHLRHEHRGLQQKAVEILAVAATSLEQAQQYCERHALPFHCLVDPAGQVLRLYNVRGRDWALEQRPGVYVVDREGVVRYSFLYSATATGSPQRLGGGAYARLRRSNEDGAGRLGHRATRASRHTRDTVLGKRPQQHATTRDGKTRKRHPPAMRRPSTFSRGALGRLPGSPSWPTRS